MVGDEYHERLSHLPIDKRPTPTLVWRPRLPLQA